MAQSKFFYFMVFYVQWYFKERAFCGNPFIYWCTLAQSQFLSIKLIGDAVNENLHKLSKTLKLNKNVETKFIIFGSNK